MNRALLENAGVGGSWKYVVSMRNALEFIRAYYQLYDFLIEERQRNIKRVASGEIPLTEEDKKRFPPGGKITIGAEQYEIRLLLEMCVQGIFQNAHSYFDYVAQCVNSIFLQGGIDESRVSFHKVRETCNKNTVSLWMACIENDPIYSFICDYNNKIKHSHMLDLNIRYRASDNQVLARTTEFEKTISKTVKHQYNKSELAETVEKVYSLLEDSFKKLDILIELELTSPKQS